MASVLSNFDFQGLVTTENLLLILRGLGIFFVGLLTVRVTSYVVRRFLMARLNEQIRLLVDKGFKTVGMTFVIIFSLSAFGVNPAPLLGAAGILGVAVSIASQNSLSNIVSGLFLISEKPFTIGDIVTASGKTGIVHSIDLLSVKIRTFDNQYVRIPSEKIFNNEVTNITRFPIRRQDFTLYLPYSTDLNEVNTILREINDENVLCLNEPEPLILYQEIGAQGMKILFGVWFVKADYVNTRNSVIEMIQLRFAQRGIAFQVPLFQSIQEGETLPVFLPSTTERV